jgi:predicted dehydrogenase
MVKDPSRRHPEPTRREMIKTVALAATSAVLSNSSLPLAQGRAPRRPQRVAVIDVSHWHSVNDASYLRILQGYKLDIVGVSDGNKAIADDRAARFNSVAFTSYREMIDKTKPDFIVALGRHIDMPVTFRYLVETGIPFLMEKPWGVDAQTVKGLADLAASKGTWACVPFPYRFSFWGETARKMVQSGELGSISHIVFRLIRPTPDRYVAWDSPWMLRKAEAGGGALINLGSHGFDLCRFITGEEPRVVSASISSAVYKLEVEDYAFVTLRTPSGIIFHNEVGYTMPTWPKNTTDGERKVAGSKAILREVPGGLSVLGADREEMIPTPKDYVSDWRAVVGECLNRLERGQPPPIPAADCAKAVALIHDAYRIASETAK